MWEITSNMIFWNRTWVRRPRRALVLLRIWQLWMLLGVIDGRCWLDLSCFLGKYALDDLTTATMTLVLPKSSWGRRRPPWRCYSLLLWSTRGCLCEEIIIRTIRGRFPKTIERAENSHQPQAADSRSLTLELSLSFPFRSKSFFFPDSTVTVAPVAITVKLVPGDKELDIINISRVKMQNEEVKWTFPIQTKMWLHINQQLTKTRTDDYGGQIKQLTKCHGILGKVSLGYYNRCSQDYFYESIPPTFSHFLRNINKPFWGNIFASVIPWTVQSGQITAVTSLTPKEKMRHNKPLKSKLYTLVALLSMRN